MASASPAKSGRRSGGHAGRLRGRARPRGSAASAPGQRGGAYKPLTERGLREIYATALRILAEIGMGDAPPALADRALEAGAAINDLGRLALPRSLVEDSIARARKEFPLYGQDPRFDFTVGGERVYFGTGGAAVRTLDLDTGRYRPATLLDLHRFARLADGLANVSWFTRCCVATDLSDPAELDLNTAYACAVGTAKPIGTSFTLGPCVDEAVAMFDALLGGEGRFRRRPFCKAHISPVVSPLRFGADAYEVALACIRHGMPINAIIAAQAGATAPGALAGALAQTTAEALAALVLVQLHAPGHPTVFSNWPFVTDLRTGSFSGAGGEISALNAASAQIGNWLGLPTGVACSMADAKAVDSQMGAEKAISALATGLAGANLIYESSGMTASLLGASFEAFVLDDEMLSHVQRAIRGVEVDEEKLGYEAILEAVTGDGHFLGGAHTLAAMERDFFYPSLANRDDPDEWQSRGAPDIRSLARERARALISQRPPAHYDSRRDRAVRDRFRILLPVEEITGSRMVGGDPRIGCDEAGKEGT